MELEQKVYMGFYLPKGNESSKKLLGISKHKDIIKTYLEHHRGLNTNCYNIEKAYISDADLLLKYSDFIISKFHGYYIPDIDQMIIECYSKQIEEDINNTIDSLKRITLLSMDIKRIPRSETASLINTLNILTKYSDSPKILEKMRTKNIHTEPFLFCDIDEYLSMIRSFKDNRELSRMYMYALYE